MRKMKKEIVRGKEISVGLEDSKRTWKLSVRCEKMEIQFTTMAAKYDNLLRYLKDRYPECKIKLIYEAGFKGFWLHDRLKKDGIECVVTPPNRVTQEKCSPIKNDKVDARRLAIVLENGDYKECDVPDQERREDRQVSRTLEGIKKDMIRTKNRIRKFFDFHGIEVDLPDGEWTDRHYESLRELKGLSPNLRISLEALISVWSSLRETAATLKAELKKLAEKTRYAKAVKIIASAPGIGQYTATRMILEWGEDWSRFGSGRKIGRFSGLVCTENSTGETDHKGHITGESRGAVRSWLIECSWTAIRKDPALLEKFQNVWHSSGSKKKAIVAVARKLVVRLRTLLLTGQTYCIGVVE